MRHTWLLAAVVACAVSSARAATTYMSGVVTKTSPELAAGDQIIATADLTVFCDEDAIIFGIILGDPGVRIEIIAQDEIVVGGSTRAGNGKSGARVDEAG